MRSVIAIAVAAVLAVPVTSAAQDAVTLPSAVTFATSTGYWEDNGNTPPVERAPQAQGGATSGKDAPTKGARHGYYKLYAVRQPDRTAKVYLQQIVQADSGPEVLSTIELEELSALKPYVTDIRPENSTGIIREPGLFATVYLKTSPDAESEGWTVLIDEFGEITIEKSSN